MTVPVVIVLHVFAVHKSLSLCLKPYYNDIIIIRRITRDVWKLPIVYTYMCIHTRYRKSVHREIYCALREVRVRLFFVSSGSSSCCFSTRAHGVQILLISASIIMILNRGYGTYSISSWRRSIFLTFVYRKKKTKELMEKICRVKLNNTVKWRRKTNNIRFYSLSLSSFLRLLGPFDATTRFLRHSSSFTIFYALPTPSNHRSLPSLCPSAVINVALSLVAILLFPRLRIRLTLPLFTLLAPSHSSFDSSLFLISNPVASFFSGP